MNESDIFQQTFSCWVKNEYESGYYELSHMSVPKWVQVPFNDPHELWWIEQTSATPSHLQ